MRQAEDRDVSIAIRRHLLMPELMGAVTASLPE
jgi:hypothetical protein